MTLKRVLVSITLLFVMVFSSSAFAEQMINSREIRRRALFGLGFEGAAAYPLDEVNRGLFSWGGTITARLEFNAHPALGIELGALGIILSQDQSPSNASWYGGRVGFRFHWSALAGWASQDGWIDAHFNIGKSGDLIGMGFDGGTGFEFALGRGFRMGPYIRYQFGFDPLEQHIQVLMFGISIGILGDPRLDQTIVYDDESEIANSTVVVPVERQYQEYPAPCVDTPSVVEGGTPDTISDWDGDGVINGYDHCPIVPSGAMPDPNRTGCPSRDYDGDGVRDAVDFCPGMPVGASAAPLHPGCPIQDHDADGIVDDRDFCPNEPVGAIPDSRNIGCPIRDRDSDGFEDRIDQCPDRSAGPNQNPNRRGCPR